MAIRKQPESAAILYGEAARLRAESIAEEKRAARKERAAEQIRSLEFRRELAQFEEQLRLEREKRNRIWQLESEERAHQWTLEKMETASRLDFAQEEKRRQERFDNYYAAIKKIDETDWLTDTQKEQYKFKAYLDLTKVDIPARILFPEAYERPASASQQMQQLLASVLTETPAEEAPGTKPLRSIRTGKAAPTSTNPLGLEK